MVETLAYSLGRLAANSISGNKICRAADQLPGGLADKIPPSKFNPKSVAKGRKVELEHTNSAALAGEIARDHLVEMPDYYDRLAKMEARRHE